MPESEKERKPKYPPFVTELQLQRIGGSVYLRVPKEFLESNDLKPDDNVGILADSDLHVTANKDKFQQWKLDNDKWVKEMHKRAEETAKK